jgi:enoyl-CoA hydratase/carnithine racemase
LQQSSELELETIRLGRSAAGVVVATLDRPERMNAMTVVMFAELDQLATALDQEEDLRVLIITGAGDRAFCAGYDLDDAAGLSELSPMEMLDRQEHAARALSAIRSIRVPVIAAINGVAAGGGLSLALAADIRLASPAARFNAAFVRIGLSAGDLGASWLLPRIVGPALAAERAYTSYAAALELEDRGQALLTRGEDMPEALAAFKAKRAPTFTGR